jgi:S-adenosyl-L-methionine hydrolase (adenosine-forming)
MRPICFISDYGIGDVLVGTCKGVMMDIAPGAPIIDVTHSVPEFDVIRGAETLRHATRYMPEGAVYLAVVDPGDNTKRRAVAAEARSGAYLVGPDNGLLLPAAEALGGLVRVVHLTNPRYHVRPVSSTFHGRDIFSPVAAHLAAGADLGDLGEEIAPAALVSLDFPGFRREPEGGLAAQIINIDRFGNARLSVMQEDLGLRYDTPLEVGVRDERTGDRDGVAVSVRDRRPDDRRGLEAMMRHPERLGIAPELRKITLRRLLETQAVMLGSPATLIDQITAFVREYRIGNLMLVMQMGEMPHELALKNLRMFSEEVLPSVQRIWDEDEWEHEWWPTGVPATADLTHA